MSTYSSKLKKYVWFGFSELLLQPLHPNLPLMNQSELVWNLCLIYSLHKDIQDEHLQRPSLP